MWNRRQLLSGGGVLLAGCGRPKVLPPMYVFVANQAGHAVAAVDLGAFAVVRHIGLGAAPTQVLAPHGSDSVYALTPETGEVHEIAIQRLARARTWRAGGTAAVMQAAPGSASLWVAVEAPARLVRLSLGESRRGEAPTGPAGMGRASPAKPEMLQAEASIALPFPARHIDISPDGRMAALSTGAEPRFALVDLETKRLLRTVSTKGAIGTLRFRKDGKLLLAADLDNRAMSLYDRAGRLLVHLPLRIRPDNLCFKADGGQAFVAGQGQDFVVTVYPYRTEVGGTTLAGHSPSALAASTAPDYLFVANSRGAEQAGNVTILSVRTQRVIGVAPVGRDPCHISITPDNQYALVLNRLSGDMAVIRIQSLTAERRKMAPLFTMVPVGSEPVSAAVCLIS